VNITQLKTFVAVVEHGSFSEAARAMGLSQPAVTMQVQALESDVNVMLLDRRYRKVDVTEAGRMLLPFARRILDEVAEARSAIDELGDSISGRLDIAASTTPGQYVLPRQLGGFLRQNPEVGITLHVGDTSEVVDLVERGVAHLGMTGAEIHGVRVDYERMGSDDLVMICPVDHPMVGRADVSITELVEEPFITRETGSGTRMVFEEAARQSGIDPSELRVVMELGTNEAVVSAVEGGMGLGIVSAWAAHKALALNTVARLPVAGFPLARPLFLVTPRGSLTRAGSALVEYLRAAEQ